MASRSSSTRETSGAAPPSDDENDLTDANDRNQFFLTEDKHSIVANVLHPSAIDIASEENDADGNNSSEDEGSDNMSNLSGTSGHEDSL